MAADQITMTAGDWMQLAGLGLMFGTFGQFVRVGVGLIKLGKKQSGDKAAIGEARDPWRIFASLVIGAAVGMPAALGTSGPTLFLGSGAEAIRGMNVNDIKGPFIASIIVAGYAGADLIEGLGRTISK